VKPRVIFAGEETRGMMRQRVIFEGKEKRARTRGHCSESEFCEELSLTIQQEALKAAAKVSPTKGGASMKWFE